MALSRMYPVQAVQYYHFENNDDKTVGSPHTTGHKELLPCKQRPLYREVTTSTQTFYSRRAGHLSTRIIRWNRIAGSARSCFWARACHTKKTVQRLPKALASCKYQPAILTFDFHILTGLLCCIKKLHQRLGDKLLGSRVGSFLQQWASEIIEVYEKTLGLLATGELALLSDRKKRSQPSVSSA